MDERPDTTAATDFDRIVLLGDSLVERSFGPGGFGASLANAYARRADVYNRGLSGYTSRWLLPFATTTITHAHLSLTNTLFFLLLLGANDACLPSTAHHVPLPEFTSNLDSLLHSALHPPHSPPPSYPQRVLLVTPPPIEPVLLAARGPRGGADRAVESTARYAQAVREAAGRHQREGAGVGLVDLYAVLEGQGREEEEGLAAFLSDGLHLNEKGYRVLFNEVMDEIARRWPGILPENLPLKQPWWGDLEAVKEFNRLKEEEEKAGKEEKEGKVNHEEL